MILACVNGHAQPSSSYSYSIFDVPNAAATSVSGVNSRGDIAGIYYTSDTLAHVFLRAAGSSSIVTIDSPDGYRPTAPAINSHGDVAFAASDPSGSSNSTVWLRVSDGTITRLAALSGGQGFATGINDQDQVIGFLFTKGPFIPFLLNPDGSTPKITLNGYVNYGIDNADRVLRVVNDQPAAGGASAIVDNPDGSPSARGLTLPHNVGNAALSNNGLIAGTYEGSFSGHGFLGEPTTRTIVAIDAPGYAGNSTVNGVNDLGVLVGSGGALQNQHGFIATPTPATTTLSAVANAASYSTGTVSPGEIVTLFGTGLGPPAVTPGLPDASGQAPTNVLTTRVLFDGVAAPLVYAWGTQVAAVVPYEVAGSTTAVQVEFQAVRSAATTVAVAPAVPGIFTLDGSGRGPGAVFNQDGSVNTAVNAAHRGDIVYFYMTGVGQTAPAGATGKTTPLHLPVDLNQPLSFLVTMGGVSAKILYDGPAPALIAGISQINVVVPADAPVGATVPLVLQVGGAVSPAGVTLAVK